MTGPGMKARILEAAAREPSPDRGRVRSRKLASAAVAAALLGLTFILVGGVHWGDRPRPFILGTSAGWLALALWVSWTTLRPRSSMLRTSSTLWWLPPALLPVAQLAWMLLWNLLWPETLAQCRGRVGLVCLDLSLAAGAIPILLLGYAWRGSEPLHPARRGLAFGAVVGSWSALAMNVGCECTNPSHILLGHVGPVLILMAAGSFVGSRLLGPRTGKGARAAAAPTPGGGAG